MGWKNLPKGGYVKTPLSATLHRNRLPSPTQANVIVREHAKITARPGRVFLDPAWARPVHSKRRICKGKLGTLRMRYLVRFAEPLHPRLGRKLHADMAFPGPSWERLS
jgi:hypothetical protein